MSSTISTAFVNQFKATWDVLPQQMGSKLENAVRIESQQGEFSFYDQIGAVTTLTEPSTSTDDTVWIYTPHSRRMVGLAPYVYAEPIPTFDKVKMLADPTNPYSTNSFRTFGRYKDDVLITAASGIAYTGKTGTTQTSFDSNMTVTSGTGSTVGLNIDKLLGAMGLLDDNDVLESDRYFVGNPKQKRDLLNSTQVTSSDFASVKALVRGDVNSFLGFDFLWTTRIVKSGDVYNCLVWHKEAMLLSIGLDVETTINQRPDKNNIWQVHMQMMIGASRMMEEAVGMVVCG